MRTASLSLCLALLACTSSTAERGSDAFWDAFSNDRYDQLPAALQGLQAAYAERPDDPDNTLLLGLANLWQLAEGAREPDRPLADRIAVALAADRYLDEARALRPGDGRVPAWVASVRIPTSMGTGNPVGLKAALELLEEAVPAHPSGNLLIAALSLSPADRDDPLFKKGVEAVWRLLDYCVEGRIDRDNPDVRPYLRWDDPSPAQRHCFGNTDRWPHQYEGLWLLLGDILVKDGRPRVAQALYRNAEAGPGYATWQDRQTLEERIDKAPQRAAAYLLPDASRHPELFGRGPRNCMVCHQR